MKQQLPRGASRRPSRDGYINILLLPFIITILFFVATAGFALWAYSSREDYRTHVDQKIDAAVKIAKQEEGIAKDKEHAEADKQPLKAYAGPEQFGSVRVMYPKTWSGYVIDTGNSGDPLNAYFQPGVVPEANGQASTFALRVQLINQSYSSVVSGLQSSVTSGTLKASAYAFPKVPSVIGVRFDGTLQQSKNVTGSLVVVPLRDKTLKVWTESPVFAADFNNFILPNITFSP